LLCCHRPRKIKAFVNLCGPLNLEHHVKTAEGVMRELSPVFQLLGGESDSLIEFAEQASVIGKITKDFPISLVIHGEQDSTVPIEESKRFVSDLNDLEVAVEHQWISGSGHRMNDFKIMPQVTRFLQKCLN